MEAVGALYGEAYLLPLVLMQRSDHLAEVSRGLASDSDDVVAHLQPTALGGATCGELVDDEGHAERAEAFLCLEYTVHHVLGYSDDLGLRPAAYLDLTSLDQRGEEAAIQHVGRLGIVHAEDNVAVDEAHGLSGGGELHASRYLVAV